MNTNKKKYDKIAYLFEENKDLFDEYAQRNKDKEGIENYYILWERSGSRIDTSSVNFLLLCAVLFSLSEEEFKDFLIEKGWHAEINNHILSAKTPDLKKTWTFKLY